MFAICPVNETETVSMELPKEVIEMSVTLKNIHQDIEDKTFPIPINNVYSKTMQKVIDWCKYHFDHPIKEPSDEDSRRTDDISPWDKEYCDIDQGSLFELLMAANYLEIKPLLDVICKTVANMIKGKTTEEIRRIFNITNDFTPEEEEQIRKENAWCEE